MDKMLLKRTRSIMESVEEDKRPLLFFIAYGLLLHKRLGLTGPLTATSLLKQWEGIEVLKASRETLEKLRVSDVTLRELADIVWRETIDDWALSKLFQASLSKKVARGLSAFHTSLPAAKMLADLALDALGQSFNSEKSLRKLSIIDPACGSGILLLSVYDEIMRRSSLDKQELHKILLEEVLHGYDVQKEAVELAKIELIMRQPDVKAEKMNLETLPLGVHGKRAYFGSLDYPFFKNFDLVIMNPPYARPGGGRKDDLYSHLDAREQKIMKKELKKIREKFVKELKLSDKNFAGGGLTNFFMLRAITLLKKDGVIAAVIPRVFLNGAATHVARSSLIDRGSIIHIVTSDDPSADWSWSDFTHMSEVLLVFKKNVNEDLLVTYVRKFPSPGDVDYYLGHIKVARELLELDKDGFSSTLTVRRDGKPVLFIYKVAHDNVVRAVKSINLSLVAGLHDSFLQRNGYRLFFEKRIFDSKEAPLIPLEDYLKTTDMQQMMECRSVPMLRYANSRTHSSFTLSEESLEMTSKCEREAGNLLLISMGRIFMTTVGSVALYSEKDVVAPLLWTVKVAPERAKLQTLWLNSTPGLLHFLSIRQDHSGPFVRLRKRNVLKMLMVDENKVNMEPFLKFFDKHGKEKLSTIRSQIMEALNGKGVRYELDKLVLNELFSIDVDKKESRGWLNTLYEKMLEETIL